MDDARDLAEMIIDLLCDRQGFDDLWYQIDGETQEEILDELEELLMTYRYIPPSEYLM